MSPRTPTPSALQSRCANCHLDDPGHEQFPSDARVVAEWLVSTRDRLAKVVPGIAAQADDVTRRQMWVTYDHAERCLGDAVGAMHGFDLAEAASLLSAARVDIRSLEKRFGTNAAVATRSTFKHKRPSMLPGLYATSAALQGYDAFSTLNALKNGGQEANPFMKGSSTRSRLLR
jgi:hypothetical protein